MCILFSFSFPILITLPCCCHLLTLFKDVSHVCCSPQCVCASVCVGGGLVGGGLSLRGDVFSSLGL